MTWIDMFLLVACGAAFTLLIVRSRERRAALAAADMADFVTCSCCDGELQTEDFEIGISETARPVMTPAGFVQVLCPACAMFAGGELAVYEAASCKVIACRGEAEVSPCA